jgi:hypothetical protein
MSFSNKVFSRGKSSRNLLVLFFYCSVLIFSLFTVHVEEAETLTGSTQLKNLLPETLSIPSEYGQVIFRHDAGTGNHLYIIGISHRDTLTRAAGWKTTQVQSEVYRIGQWLIENEDVDLLLPEGFFTTPGSRTVKRLDNGMTPQSVKAVFNTGEILKEKLDSSNYVNAEKLLMESHDIVAQQVEDDSLYRDVVNKIILLEKNTNKFEYMYASRELDYLQERRTAAMLQKIPEVVESQIRDGNISQRNAILTIGVSHLAQIIDSLRQNKFIVRSPAFSPFNDYISEINLVREGFNVTVILPRTIAEDRDILKLTKLVNETGRLPETVASTSEFSTD